MSNSLKSNLDTYLKLKKEADQLYEKIYKDLIAKAIDILLWENENIGTEHDVKFNHRDYSYHIEFLEKSAVLEVDITWPYGGYERENHYISYEKLLNNDWKEKVLKEYKDKCEQERKLKEQKEQEEKAALLDKERKEYERLRAKFEQGSLPFGLEDNY